jgi:hypothetical protein
VRPAPEPILSDLSSIADSRSLGIGALACSPNHEDSHCIPCSQELPHLQVAAPLRVDKECNAGSRRMASCADSPMFTTLQMDFINQSNQTVNTKGSTNYKQRVQCHVYFSAEVTGAPATITQGQGAAGWDIKELGEKPW